MSKFQSISIFVIAMVLLAEFCLAHVWPRILLKINEDQYLSLANACHEALSNMKEVEAVRHEYDRTTSRSLQQASNVALMDCYPLQRLHRSLVAGGVSQEQLDLLDLKSKSAADVSLNYFIEDFHLDQ